METLLGLAVGIGLSAACGFRVFVPFLGMGIASAAGHLTLADGFEWIGTMPAIIAFATATVVEILAYYVPWVDNLLDTAAIPAAVIAGTMVTASQIESLSPLMRWSLAAIAGGGTSLVIQSGTTTARLASTVTTGGLGNFVLATAEWMIAIVICLMAIVVPVFCLLIVVAILCKLAKLLIRTARRVPSVSVSPTGVT